VQNIIKYRSYQTSDFQDLLAFLSITEKDFYPPLSERTTLRNYLLNDLVVNSHTYLALHNDSIIGFINLQINEPAKNETNINTVAIHPKFRKMGIATQLMENVINFSKSNGFSCIKTRTWSINNSGLGLYNKFGFAIDYIVKNDRENNVDSIYLVKRFS
jgi:ribosomal protein S18 acetylase RimI-like enzyme